MKRNEDDFESIFSKFIIQNKKIDRIEQNTRRQIDAQNCENERKEEKLLF